MRKSKKLLTLTLAVAMSFSLFGCNDKSKDDKDKTYKIGIVQLVQHEALDAATTGFQDA